MDDVERTQTCEEPAMPFRGNSSRFEKRTRALRARPFVSKPCVKELCVACRHEFGLIGVLRPGVLLQSRPHDRFT